MNQDSQGKSLVACLPVLRAYVRRISGDRQTAKELLQETSVRIMAGEGPRDPERFVAWCCGIARHALSRDWRKRKRARAELPLEGALVEQIRAPYQDPEGYLDARAWMARALRHVDGEALELLMRRYVLGESGSELADQMAQSAAGLRMRLMRLRSTLSAHCPAPLTPAPSAR
jgi:RNA polymerase sigma factor (sigma-70 family)